jgi:hypothetical protein
VHEDPTVRQLAEQLTLGALLGELCRRAGRYELLAHWQQGEFHHDTVLRVDAERANCPLPSWSWRRTAMAA